MLLALESLAQEFREIHFFSVTYGLASFSTLMTERFPDSMKVQQTHPSNIGDAPLCDLQNPG